MPARILIIGGYGVFGGRLARLLKEDARFECLIAGRSLEKAESFCAIHGGTPIALDLSADNLFTRIADLSPFIIVDAAGPFQTYQSKSPYRLAEAAIACGAHYLDLSDDAAFTKNICALEAKAKAKGVTILSGVSSVPALSSSIASALMRDMQDIHLVESVILPGNKAPRGLSVIRAILSQSGNPMQVWQNSQWTTVTGWSALKSLTLTLPGLPPLKGRWASFIGAPDLALFPDFYKARSVLFRAGLDLKVMHGGLALLSLPVRWGLMRSLAPLSKPLKWVANALKPFGSDRGGMQVRVIGTAADSTAEERIWTLIAEKGDGPFIPAIPAQILCDKLYATEIEPGARPALNAFSQQEAETALGTLHLKTHTQARSLTPLFAEALGDSIRKLPPPLQDLHTVLTSRRWIGKASITRGKGLLARLAAWLIGFPQATQETDVEVSMARIGNKEIWTRRFGAHSFSSRLSLSEKPGEARLIERFGLLRFTIALEADTSAVRFPVTRGTCLGLPLPGFLLPRSETREYVNSEGAACFRVELSLPVTGHIITYDGALRDASTHPETSA